MFSLRSTADTALEIWHELILILVLVSSLLASDVRDEPLYGHIHLCPSRKG